MKKAEPALHALLRMIGNQAIHIESLKFWGTAALKQVSQEFSGRGHTINSKS